MLPTDSDFQGFCVDYFLAIAERFSNGMDRVAKATVLLQLADLGAIVAALQQYNPKLFAKHARQQLALAASASGKNPYRGLAAFQPEESHLFFGREALTGTLWQRFEALYEKVGTPRLLPVLGPSGSGKSSVARAGLLAALMQSPVPGPQAMRTVIVKPGERPIESLARALVSLLPTDSAVIPAQRAIAIEHLLRNPAARGEGLRRFAADLQEINERPLLLLVDQFEEVYTLSSDPAERDLFVELLLHATQAQPPQVAVVLTLRSDFLGETQRCHSPLNRIIAAQGVIVPALSPEELREVIARPAEQEGRPLDRTTVELLLGQARGSQGALPLLEFTLTRIWEGMERGEEPGAILGRLGDVGGALAGEAQKIYKTLSGHEQEIARRALVRLVRLGEGTHDTRRRAPVSEIGGRGVTEAEVLAVLRKFAAENARLLTLSGDGTDTIAEVTHEALFDHWAELRTWINDSRRDRGLHDRALEAAKLWRAADELAGRLWRPPDLDLLRDYQQRKPAELTLLQEEFLAAGIRQQRRERLVSLSAVLAVLVAVVGAGGIYLAKERQRAREAQERLLDAYVERGQHLLFKDEEASAGLLWLQRAQAEGSRSPILPHLLKSAMDRVDTIRAVLLGHRDRLTSAAFSPDGHRLVTTSADGTARVWDVESERLVTEIKGPKEGLGGARFSPDSHRIVVACWDSVARVWEAESGRLIAELKGHTKELISVEFSPEGDRIITAGLDGTTRVWAAADGQLVVELKGDGSIVWRASFSPDGRRIVTANTDATARVWDSRSGRLLNELRGHRSFVADAAYSPDGRLIATASVDGTARVWLTQDGSLLTEFGGFDPVFRAAFSPDSRLLLTTSKEGAVRVWRVVDRRLLAELRGHWDHKDRGRSAAFSPDSHRIVTSSPDHTAQVWEAESGRPVAELQGHGAHVHNTAFSPDGRYIVTASDDGTARIWSAESTRLERELKGHASGVLGATLSPDGRRFVTVSEDSTARVWETAGGRLVSELRGHGSIVLTAAFSSDGSRVVTASWDHTARLWEAETGRQLAALAGHGDKVRSATFSPDGKRIATASDDHTARVWDAGTGRQLAELGGHADTVTTVAFSPDGRRIVTAGDDNTARIWEAGGGWLVAELKGHTRSITGAAFSPDGHHIITASVDDTARIWEAGGGRLVAELKGHTNNVTSAAFSPNGHRIVTTSHDGTARIWEAASGRLAAELKGHASPVTSALFSPDGHRIVTASWDHTARMWDADSGLLLAELRGHRSAVTSANFSRDGRRIVTASEDGTARIWDASPETRTAKHLARLIRCYLPARFEDIGSQVIVPALSNPAECQAEARPRPGVIGR